MPMTEPKLPGPSMAAWTNSGRLSPSSWNLVVRPSAIQVASLRLLSASRMSPYALREK